MSQQTNKALDQERERFIDWYRDIRGHCNVRLEDNACSLLNGFGCAYLMCPKRGKIQ